MPTYDYRCENCGDFEKVQKMSEAALAVCPQCGGKVERLISKNVGIVLKGSGFYKTDNNQKDRARRINKERQVDNQACWMVTSAPTCHNREHGQKDSGGMKSPSGIFLQIKSIGNRRLKADYREIKNSEISLPDSI